MKLILKLWILILAVIMAANPLSAVTVNGTLKGHDGKPMKLAHVQELAQKESADEYMHNVSSDGTFSFQSAASGCIKLRFTGVDHKHYETNIILLEGDKEINLDVRLSFNSIDKVPENLSLISSFNRFNFNEGTVDMNKNDKGIFKAEIEWPGDSLHYQIIGLFDNETVRSVNGSSDAYIYDGDGDYRSIDPASGGKVKITFDPSKYMTKESSPSISSPDKNLNSYLELEKSYADQKMDFMKNLYPFTPDKYQYYLDFGNRIIEEIKLQKDKRKRIAAILTYLAATEGGLYYGIPEKCNAQMIDIIAQDIPPASEIWAVYTRYLVNLYGYIDCDKAIPFVKEVMTKNPDENAMLGISQRIDGIDALRSAKNSDNFGKFLADKMAIPQILEFAVTLAHYRKDTLALNNILNKLYKDYETEFITLRAKYNFDPNRKIQIGNMLPDFELVDINDSLKIYNLSEFKGKYVLVDVWATWCGPCVGELPNLTKAWELYKDKNFMIYSISFDQSPDKVAEFRNSKFEMPWIHSFAEGGFRSKIGQLFEVMGIPRPILIDPDGKIIEMEGGLRGNLLFKTLERFLD